MLRITPTPVRITPTRVGNSGLKLQPPIPPPDHPHTRGEQYLSNWEHLGRRIAPTHVGNGLETAAKNLGIKDHPHIRGELHIKFLGRQPHWIELPLQRTKHYP